MHLGRNRTQRLAESRNLAGLNLDVNNKLIVFSKEEKDGM